MRRQASENTDSCMDGKRKIKQSKMYMRAEMP
uniref:Uncharacterized protein n=1 Tax=Rhizophora mucronata TaxID=61149 RepID=A0A2P2PR95_RHIMU